MSKTHKPQTEKKYGDLTEYQQQILDLRSKGMKKRTAIADEVGCGISHVTKTLNVYDQFIPTPDYRADAKNPAMVADGGTVQSKETKTSNSVTVTIECDCGETHEVSIE